MIDIQNDYFPNGANPLIGAEPACENAALLLDYFRSKDQMIIHIQHLATRANATFFLPDTHGAELHPRLEPHKGEIIITKHFPNSFRETVLLDVLLHNSISKLVICGMMTHMCVDATVRAAKDFGFECIVAGDACATKNLELDGRIIPASDVHYSFLAALGYFYASIQHTQSLIG